MKLQNKKTGEIAKLVGYVNTGDDRMFFRFEDNKGTYKKEYNSLDKLNEEWEDYEEPKEDEFFKFTPGLVDNRFVVLFLDEKASRKEAKKLLAKLKAYKRLKDKGLRFFNNKIIGEYGNVSYRLTYPATTIEEQDLDLLFGGEA